MLLKFHGFERYFLVTDLFIIIFYSIITLSNLCWPFSQKKAFGTVDGFQGSGPTLVEITG